jgi:O-antigen/teichoic acid export membrane protein
MSPRVHTVRRTLLALGIGVVVQRLAQLGGFLCIGRSLGVDGLGVYAQGLGLAGLVVVLAGAGVRNLVARAVARDPGSARTLVAAAFRARLRAGAAIAAAGATIALWTADEPLFWILCLLQALPAAFDLRTLLDVAGGTRREVALETAASLVQFALVAAWTVSGGGDLATLAAIALGTRCIYAMGSLQTLLRLPRGTPGTPAPDVLRGSGWVSLGQAAHEVMTVADVLLVAAVGGEAAAGLYAVASRLAGAALVPSLQLVRLLLPHQLRAAAAGDAERTTATALRTTLFATLPMAAGGAVTAAPLCGLFGAGFAAAAPVLQVLLVAGCLQHVGWLFSHMLLARGRDRWFAASLGASAVLHASFVALLAPAGGATGAAVAGLVACTVYAVVGAGLVRTELRAALRRAPLAPSICAAATAAAAFLPTTVAADANLVLAAQLAAGAAALAATLWAFEFRGRLRRIGDGLAAASGFRA